MTKTYSVGTRFAGVLRQHGALVLLGGGLLLPACASDATSMDGAATMISPASSAAAGASAGATKPAGSVAGAAAPTTTGGAKPATGGAVTTPGAPGATGAMGAIAAAGSAAAATGAAGGAAPSSAGAAGAAGSTTMAAVDPNQPHGTEADYKDPGDGDWPMGTSDECGISPAMIKAMGNIAAYRHGKLCFIAGGDTSGQNYSATKTIGGVAAGRADYLVKDVMRSGPGTGHIIHEDKAVDWLGTVSYNREAMLSHVMSMTAFNSNLAYGSKMFSYDTLGTREISSIVDVAMKAVGQIQGVPTDSSQFFAKEVFAKLGMKNSSWSGGTIGTGWTGNMSDMGKVGAMLAHDGWYNGKRFMSRYWVYRMSHPAHEDANTSYGQLAWLNHRGNASGIGGDIASGSNGPMGDPCAPAAFWPKYPHVGSEAPDCRAMFGDKGCKQTYDIGVFSAQGLGGQFVVVHPGLDLVIIAHNFSNMDGPMGMWNQIRPGLVAMDPKFKGDEKAFCKAYGDGDYAPDLVMPRGPDL